jgi:hypothetical protein
MFIDADQHMLAGGPGTADGMGLHIFDHVAVHPLGGAPKRQFAQGGDVAGRKEMPQCPLRLGLHIDLALLEPLQKFIGGGVHHFDFVGFVQHFVRYGLAHMDAGDLRDHVIEAFDVLDVHRGIDVDSGRQEFLDVEITLGVAASLRVGVGQLIHQDQGGMTLQNGVEIHLSHDVAFVKRAFLGNDFEALAEDIGFHSAVGFHHTDHYVGPFQATPAALGEHLIGLAHARRRAQEDLELAPPLFGGFFQQRLGRRPLFGGSDCHP